MSHASPDGLPHHQSKTVDVHLAEVLELRHVDGHVQDLGGHVPLGAHPGVGRDVGLASGLGVGHGKAKVSNDTASVSTNKDVFRLDVFKKTMKT